VAIWSRKTRQRHDSTRSRAALAVAECHSALTFGQYGYEFTLAPTPAGGLVFVNEQLFWVGADQRLTLGTGHAESALKDQRRAARGMIAKIVYGAISGWGLFHFRNVTASAWIRRAWAVKDSARLRPNGENLAAVLYAIQQGDPDRYADIRTTIQQAVPLFDDFVLTPEPAPKHGEQIRLMWGAWGSPAAQTTDTLSDDALRLMGWVTALMQPHPPPTLILELPDMMPLLSNLIRTAAQASRVIVVTRSAEMPALSLYA